MTPAILLLCITSYAWEATYVTYVSRMLSHCAAAALEAFGQALSIHRKKQQAVLEANEAREAKREALAAAGDDALAAQLEGGIEVDEPVPVVPAKLLNNTAVLKYRCAGGRVLAGSW
jgi:hypothetical protein